MDKCSTSSHLYDIYLPYQVLYSFSLLWKIMSKWGRTGMSTDQLLAVNHTNYESRHVLVYFQHLNNFRAWLTIAHPIPIFILKQVFTFLNFKLFCQRACCWQTFLCCNCNNLPLKTALYNSNKLTSMLLGGFQSWQTAECFAKDIRSMSMTCVS
jgi:hypothetical protein